MASLIAGAVCTVAGLFPAVAMKLLDFVGLYGTTLAPVGAVIFVDVYLAKKFGLTQNWAEKTGKSFKHFDEHHITRGVWKKSNVE